MTGILKLQTENVKRLKAVEINPDGSLVIISGRNGSGKTSVLDSIWMALGGKAVFPRKPVRDGAASASIRLELDCGLIITRTIHPDGQTRLTVTAKDGATYKSPQALLDGLVGGLSFDPLAFSRMSARDQGELLRKLVGLDTSALDQERAEVYERRTADNRDVKRLEAELAGLQHHPDAPAAEVSVSALAGQLREADNHQQKIAVTERQLTQAQDKLVTAESHAAGLVKKLEELRIEIAKTEERIRHGEAVVLPGLRKEVDTIRRYEEGLKAEAPDREAIARQITEAEGVNAKVRANTRRAEVLGRHVAGAERTAALTARIEALDTVKRQAIAAATYPLSGLTVDDQGVLLNGVPFEQASHAEQLRASVAIGIALNPKLRVLLVRDGSLLDTQGMALLGEMAAAAGAQVWVEVVSDGEQVGIVIEDGSVRGAAVPAEAQEAAAP